MKLHSIVLSLVLVSANSLNAQEVNEIPLKCSVEELEYLMAKSGFMDTEYCFDFTQSETVGFNLGDGMYDSGSYDYLTDRVRSISSQEHNAIKSRVCGGDHTSSDGLSNISDNEQADLDAITSSLAQATGADNPVLNQVLKIPGVLNELVSAIINNKKEFDGDFDANGIATGIARVSRSSENASQVVLHVKGFADGQYNGIKYYDSKILSDLCEKNGDECKEENGKLIINTSTNALKAKLKAAKVEADEAVKAALEQEYVKDVNCSSNPNHSTCKMLARLQAESVNIDSLKYDSIPSVCSRGIIAPANREKSELLPSMLRNYYLAEDRAMNLAHYLTNNLSIGGVTKGPDLNKVFNWELTAPIEDHQSQGFGVCDLRRGAKVEMDLNLPEMQGSLLNPYAEFTAPFASPSYHTQRNLQLAAVLDVFRRLGRRPEEEKKLFEALFKASEDNVHSISKIHFDKLAEELANINFPMENKTPPQIASSVLEKVDEIVFKLLPYSCQNVDYTNIDANDVEYYNGLYDFPMTSAKKIIFDMMAGFIRSNKTYADFAKLYTEPYEDIKNLLPPDVLLDAESGFTGKYGKKILYKDVDNRSDSKIWGANQKATSSFDFYFSGVPAPGKYLADYRNQNDQYASRYDRHIRRYLTPHISIPVSKYAIYGNKPQGGELQMSQNYFNLYKTYHVFIPNGDGTFTDQGPVGKDLKDYYSSFKPQYNSVTQCNASGQKVMFGLVGQGGHRGKFRVLNVNQGNRTLEQISPTDLNRHKRQAGLSEGGTAHADLYLVPVEGRENTYSVGKVIGSIFDYNSCEKGNSQNILAKITPLYSPFYHHAGGVTPSSVMNCFSAKEGYVYLYKYFDRLKAIVENPENAENENLEEFEKGLNDMHFAFTDYKSIAAPDINEANWRLKVNYSSEITKNIDYQGYTHEHTFDSVKENKKHGFLCGGWGSGVSYERSPASNQMPVFKYYEKHKDEADYKRSMKYAVQFKKAYEKAKSMSNKARFEYISRFRERDEFDQVDETYGESAAQLYYNDALTKYFQLRAYMDEHYINKSSQRPIEDYVLFGESKSPHLIVLKNCGGCECVKDLNSFNQALSNADFHNFYDGYPSDGKKEVEINLSGDNANACLFTQYVPHTCSFRPRGNTTTNDDRESQKMNVNVACNLTRYLQSRLQKMKARAPGAVKSDEQVQEIIQKCRTKTYHFPLGIENFNQGTGGNYSGICRNQEDSNE